MKVFKKIVKAYNKTSLVLRILIGLFIGALLGVLIPDQNWIYYFGTVFIGALKAIAPLLVFILVISSLANGVGKMDHRFGVVVFLYLFSTFLAAFVSVCISFIFPQTLTLKDSFQLDASLTGIGDVFENLITSMFQNPIYAIGNAQYISILVWAVILGLALKRIAKPATKKVVKDFSDMLTTAIKWIINLAPLGIMGIVYVTVSENGLGMFKEYGFLVLVLGGSMVFIAFVVNPLLSFLFLHKNPYPLVLRCLKESGITAFFTRSSAANIPINMELCRKLGLDEDMYSVAIPLGATVNMDGAAVTITVLTLATANTVGVQVDFWSALVLSLLATLGACGASGVAGGSLMLIPMACSMFGISNEIAMQAVSVGFIIGVVQDSMETALNSSGDVFFTATAEYYAWRKKGKSLPKFLGGDTDID